MTEQTAFQNKMLDTSSSEAASNWDQLLQLQTEMFLPSEIKFFLSCKEWLDAQSVLDVGCGNGAYISKIAHHFPEKTYLGIDTSPELISVARQRKAAPSLCFEQRDFYEFQSEELFDVVVMRLIVQHLKGFEPVLCQASRLLKPGGSLVIIEPDLPNSWNRPETPKFERLLKNVQKNSLQNQTNRSILSELDHIVSMNENWSTEENKTISIPYVGSFEDSNLLRLYNLWIDILNDSQVISLPIWEVRRELQAWSQRLDSYAQIGVRFMQLRCGT